MFAVDGVGSSWGTGSRAKRVGRFGGRVHVLVGCVDNRCLAGGGARCNAEIVQQIPVSCAEGAGLADSSIVDSSRSPRLYEAPGWRGRLEALGEADVPGGFHR